MKGKRVKIAPLRLVELQLVVIVYTLSGVVAKFASRFPFLSWEFFLGYGCEILILAIYSLFWQQIIKRFDLSVAYTNRSLALLWSMGWAALIFHEIVTWKNLLGVAVVIFGIWVVNSDD